jgi:hypothetical protein
LADQEQKLKRLYGKLPPRKNILGQKLQVSYLSAASVATVFFTTATNFVGP